MQIILITLLFISSINKLDIILLKHNAIKNSLLAEEIKNKYLNKTMNTLDSLLKSTWNGYDVRKDSFSMCAGCEEYYPVYKFYDYNNKILFFLEFNIDSNNMIKKVFRIKILSSDIITNKGIKIGMTLKNLKKQYEILEIVANAETGIHVIVKNFSGSFGLEFPKNINVLDLSQNNIPEDLTINEIIII